MTKRQMAVLIYGHYVFCNAVSGEERITSLYEAKNWLDTVVRYAKKPKILLYYKWAMEEKDPAKIKEVIDNLYSEVVKIKWKTREFKKQDQNFKF